MYFPIQNSNSFQVFYMGTDPNVPEPGKYVLELRKKGIRMRLFRTKGSISKEQLIKAEV